ncbi:hypothetical protein RRG08_017372 [Elysia crispata]|uniref:Uncharacterized protein n=1 Tax=Elysia crispata TaxID=231223 RepID=A0AAE1DWZ8_9GAST|nr:hypothetical protein RRG08_017372 [Elysia crispata]
MRLLNFNQTHWQVINVYITSSYPQGVQPDHVVAPRHIHLQWPGDVIDLELLAFAFYHVNGTNVFYLYARPKGLGKLRFDAKKLILILVSVSGSQTCIFVVVIVKTQDKGIITAVSGNGLKEYSEKRNDILVHKQESPSQLTSLKTYDINVINC